MKIAFYISGSARRLCNIIKDERFIKLNIDLSVVITDDLKNGEEIKSLCDANGIEWLHYDYFHTYDELPKSEKNKKLSDYILLELKKRNIEYMFTFGHHLLSGELLNEYKNKIICFHPSILPSYTGFNAIDQAVRKKENLIGNSAFFIDEGVDTGKVIIQSVKHVDNFKNNDYEAMLNPIVDMFYYIYKMLVEDRIYVDAERAYIRNADYNRVHYFPEIWS